MRISLVVTGLFAKDIIRAHKVFAPAPLADSLMKELVARGHTVTLFAPKNSTFSLPSHGEEYPIFENALKKSGLTVEKFLRTQPEEFYRINEVVRGLIAFRAIKEAHKRKTEIIHFYHHGSYIPFMLAQVTNIPTVFSLHDPLIPFGEDTWWKQPYYMFPRMHYVSLTKQQQKQNNHMRFSGVVPNCINTHEYAAQYKPGRYLAWIGRALPKKGPHIAARVAEASKTPLHIASPEPDENEKMFWKKQVLPYIRSGSARHVGFVRGRKKIQFLQNAKALLFPIQWDEPFGIVMIEAMACGTPVIAFDRGSVREVIRHGKTGFIVKNETEMKQAIKNIHRIRREDCRAWVEQHFSPETMAKQYETIYKKIVSKN
jgi:glycosyltransferase involved in cell wall biosynthesis